MADTVNRKPTVSRVADRVAIKIVGANPPMAGAAIVVARARGANTRRCNDQRLPVDFNAKIIGEGAGRGDREVRLQALEVDRHGDLTLRGFEGPRPFDGGVVVGNIRRRARSTTRLNSSHPSISYAV